jgi:hypothetical protein
VTLAARNVDEVHMVGSDGVFIWRESGVRLSVLCSCVYSSLASVAMKTFLHSVYLK